VRYFKQRSFREVRSERRNTIEGDLGDSGEEYERIETTILEIGDPERR